MDTTKSQRLSFRQLASWLTHKPINRSRAALLLAMALAGLAPAGALAACGANGEAPCVAIPPCQTNLTVNPGTLKCYHPACGKHDQTACRPDVRLQPCDWGYVPDLANKGKCVAPKETVAAKEADRVRRQGICKAAVTGILSGNIPPELQAIAKQLTSRAAGPTIARLKSADVRKETLAFAKRNLPFFKQAADAGNAIKRNKDRFKALFAPDKVCGGRTASQWIAELRALGISVDFQPLKLSENEGAANVHPVALKPGYWIVAPMIGAEAHVDDVQTLHAIVLMIPGDGSWSQVLYVPSVSAATANLFAGVTGGVKFFWPPASLEEHLPIGGELALGVSPSAIYELLEFFLWAEGVPVPPSIVGVDITGSVIWDDVANKLFKGHLVPGGFSVEVSLGIHPIPIPATLRGGIEGGVLLYQFP